jgi:hypothetical protein
MRLDFEGYLRYNRDRSFFPDRALFLGFPNKSQIEWEVTMARYHVTCINKRGSHLDPHERIEYIGNQNEQWKLSEDAAIRAIENYTSSFYTQVNGKEADVVVASHNGRKYLRTTADGYRPDNLLSLTECIGCKVKA